ncbi:MAG: hypothetical protein GF353_28770 [Candidatus Lokiarchaeota archaeon]|nr:hypothetical protein [Candidatus Lokiarchaeota archaeon]
MGYVQDNYLEILKQNLLDCISAQRENTKNLEDSLDVSTYTNALNLLNSLEETVLRFNNKRSVEFL